jgi:hypothetical protein
MFNELDEPYNNYVCYVLKKSDKEGLISSKEYKCYNDFSYEHSEDIRFGDLEKSLNVNYIDWLEEYAKNEKHVAISLWINYAKSMAKRRPDSILDVDRFLNYLKNDDVYAFILESEGGIIGQLKYGVFKPSHFCPNGSSSGVKILKKLKEYNNIVFFVTDDLISMLQKLGYHTSNDTNLDMEFRGEVVKKHIATSSLLLLSKVK